MPEQQHRQKVAIEFSSGNTSFDVTISYHVQKQLYGRGKWLVDLRDLLKDKKLTTPDFDFPDFAKGAIDYATQKDGRLDTLPLNLDHWVLYCNKELFAAKGVPIRKPSPRWWRPRGKLNDPQGQPRLRLRGLKNANVPVWTSFLLGYGVDSIDAQQPHHGHARGDRGGEDLPDPERNTGRPASPVSTGTNARPFPAGKAAMWLDGIGFSLPLEDPTKSHVVGKVGYGVMPPGPKAQHSALFGDGIGMSNFSKKKEAAWLYCNGPPTR